MTQTNFLIGRGEKLTFAVKGPSKPITEVPVYSFEQAKTKLEPQLEATARSIDALDANACPGDFAVAKLVLNPSYIARSYFPRRLLDLSKLQSVGSRTVKITPERWKRKIAPTSTATTEIFVAGRRSAFRNLRSLLNTLAPDSKEAQELARIERFAAVTPEDRIIDFGSQSNRFFEVGIHMIEGGEEYLQQAFKEFAQQAQAHVHVDLDFSAGGLWFVPVECDLVAVSRLAEFAFVRVIRPVPKMRGMRPILRNQGATVACALPAEGPLSTQPRVAILDGGLPDKHPIGKWVVNTRVMDDTANDEPGGPEHGLGVTSAFLFGPIEPGKPAERPFSLVDNIRVLDDMSNEEDPLELYRTLGNIEDVLVSRQYEFLNLSLGPDLPIEDNEVHAWTSVIDSYLSDGKTFMTVAAGNNGQSDEQLRLNRVQVPSDCVNAIAVGAANNVGEVWDRASYSAKGPGRSPGVIKPDVVAFGGDGGKYFHVLAPGAQPSLVPQLGTSFAAPYLLRNAVGIRSILGEELSPLAIKALLIHAAHQTENHCQWGTGWGKPPEDLMSVITCGPGIARVVYKGELEPGKYLRAPLPLPLQGLEGMVTLTATFCYASPTDPQDAASYTRAGLEVTFRPSDERQKEGAQNADTKGFFSRKKFATEQEQRSDQGKWETVLHNSKRMRASSLNKPAFDIHYNAREGGASTRNADVIPYALILTVHAPKCPDIYNDILRAYNQTLVQIQPKVNLQVRN
ncbi:S8 family peptidase [Comamonas thiooxydans]|uniref:S8 family peptidase n=1 Tax=Comamonas thiooxydans TaxID=363952 RepID=UPI002113A463|nr:S8 family peptidase [Comamonas thiooxydans]UUE94303.1 S8 family peptidase [Comamonas thiooxydans]